MTSGRRLTETLAGYLTRVAVLSSALEYRSATDVVAAARAAELDGIEWALGPGQAIRPETTADELEAIRELCLDECLTICGACVQDASVDLGAADAIESYLELAAGLQAPHLRVLAPAGEAARLTADWDGMRKILSRYGARATTRGARVLVETSPGTVVSSAESARRLMAGNSAAAVGVVYDPGNTIIEGSCDPRVAVSLLGRYLQHVHVKNIAWEFDGAVWSWRYCEIDAGLVEWERVLHALAETRYAGWLTIDHLSEGAAEDALCQDVITFRRLIADGQPGRERDALRQLDSTE